MNKQMSSSIDTEQSISEFSWSKPTFVCNYTFPINLAPNGIPFGAKLIGEV